MVANSKWIALSVGIASQGNVIVDVLVCFPTDALGRSNYTANKTPHVLMTYSSSAPTTQPLFELFK